MISKCNNCKIKSSAVKTLSLEELDNLSMNCAEVNFKNGDTIIKQDAFSSNIVYIKSGLVKISISNHDKFQIVKVAKGPSFLGLPTTFNERINHYSATSIGQTSVCFIDIEIFKNFIYMNGKFAYEIIVELCHNELNFIKKYYHRTQKNIHGRIAEVILFFSRNIYNSDEFDLPLSRLELGNYVDTSRESACRILTNFHKDNVINIKGKHIKILNNESLEAISKYG